MLAWEEYLFLRELRRKPMSLDWGHRRVPSPWRPPFPLELKSFQDSTRKKWLPSASSHILWDGDGKGSRIHEMDSDNSIHPMGSWKAWLEHPVDARPLMTSGLVGVIDWDGPWGPVFREQAPLNFLLALLTGGGCGTWTPMVSSPASWLRLLLYSCSLAPLQACRWLWSSPFGAYLHGQGWTLGLVARPTRTSSVFCHLLLVDGSCILLEAFPLTTPIPSQ